MRNFKSTFLIGKLCILALLVSVSITEAADPNKLDKARFSYAVSAHSDMVNTRWMDKYKYPYETVEQLLEATKSTKSLIRTVSLDMLVYRIGDNAKPYLIKALDDPHVSVRARAAELLGFLGDGTGLPQLQRDFDGLVAWISEGPKEGPENTWAKYGWAFPGGYIRKALHIGRLLAQFGDNRAFGLAAKLALEDKDPTMRDYAIWVLAAIAENDRSVLLAENRDPYPIFVLVAQNEKDRLALRTLILAAASMPAEIQTKVWEAIIASPNAPEEVKAEARSWKQIRAARIEWRKREQQRREQLQRRPEQ